ncbi:hypothetical protein N7540_005324 [Penicillium herquei]|nr:hypothetical protein N7540_005324 [Penicillium herquei]
MGSTSVRRNLFQQNISRRPTPAPSVQGTNGLSTRPSNRLKHSSSDSSMSLNSRLAENKDIVVRDKNGGYKLDIPTLPRSSLLGNGEELDELDGEEMRDLPFDPLGNEQDKEKFDAALVEMMIRHRNRQSIGEPDEVLNIVHQNLRKKVDSLDDDNWMFESDARSLI